MRIEITDDAEAFAAVAEPLLRTELAYNVLGTTLAQARAGLYQRARFAYGTGDDVGVLFAAIQTPPWHLLVTRVSDEATGALVQRWLEVDPELAGVAGPPETARAVADAWARVSGGRHERTIAMALMQLTEVIAPARPAPGRLRLATPSERPWLLEWWSAFAADTGLHGRQSPAALDARLHDDRVFLWEHDGRPVSLVGVQTPVDGVVRVGPVYTPRELRGRGYAGTAVAEVSRRLLAAGARACALTTDLANPTSNKIYQEVGYRRAGEWEERSFHRN